MNAPLPRVSEGLVLPQPYLLFLGDTTEASFAKTAFGLAHWAPGQCVGEMALPGAKVSTGLAKITPAQARDAGAQSLVVGVANQGGVLGEGWIEALVEALDAGLHLISGLHVRLSSVPALAEAAKRNNRRLIDIRTPPSNLPVGTGRKRSGKRLLTVGTDCALGKKYTALALHRAFLARGLDADFRATGQTGKPWVPLGYSPGEHSITVTLNPSAAARWRSISGSPIATVPAGRMPWAASISISSGPMPAGSPVVTTTGSALSDDKVSTNIRVEYQQRPGSESLVARSLTLRSRDAGRSLGAPAHAGSLG